MKINIITKKHKHYPLYLKEIAHPPKQLYVIGEPLSDYTPSVTIVGSRKLTNYGKEVTYRLAYDLAKQGITVISGLALGADSIAHQAALDAGGRTIAVLACGLDTIYPASHRNLAIQILKQNGTIISEYPEGMPALKQNFIARNRLVSGLSDIVLITEAAEASGSLVTAKFAIEQNKTVCAVPGQITSGQSVGTNNLIKSGAMVVTEAQDILHLLGIQSEVEHKKAVFGDTKEEQLVIDLIQGGITTLDELQIKSALEPALFSQTITMLEISDKIRPLGGAHWTIK
ncbi:DNA-processing protein DprA [Candidatus Saccharibacteria bacterium]|nr:DNA-processing protein DprA [Candidatus Saccharibacteria bacterium]